MNVAIITVDSSNSWGQVKSSALSVHYNGKLVFSLGGVRSLYNLSNQLHEMFCAMNHKVYRDHEEINVR